MDTDEGRFTSPSPLICLILAAVLEFCWSNVRVLAFKVTKLISGPCPGGQEQVDLLAQLQTISMQDDFAKYARIKRKLNKLENEFAAYGKLIWKRSLWAQVPAYILLVLSSLAFAVAVRSSVAFQLPADWVYPFGSVFAFPTGLDPGAVSMWWWLVACRQLFNFLHSAMIRSRAAERG